MNKHIVQLIRERFYPLIRFCGPQSAGEGLCSWSFGGSVVRYSFTFS